jgi:hypothetical protein
LLGRHTRVLILVYRLIGHTVILADRRACAQVGYAV